MDLLREWQGLEPFVILILADFLVTCITFNRKVGLGSSARRSAGVEAGGARTNTSK